MSVIFGYCAFGFSFLNIFCLKKKIIMYEKQAASMLGLTEIDGFFLNIKYSSYLGILKMM